MLHASIANNSVMWFSPARDEKGSMAHMFPGPQLPLHLHQLHNPQQDLSHLISFHRLSHILPKIWVSLEHLRHLISLSYLSHLEVPLSGYLNQVQLIIWFLIILSLHTILLFLILLIYTANGAPLAVTQSGNIILTFDPSGRITLSSVFSIPELTMQLLTVGKIIDCNCNILFTPTSCIIQDYTSRKIGTWRNVNGLYQLEYIHLPLLPHPTMSLSVTSDLWHRRLGYLFSIKLKTLSNTSVLEIFIFLAQIIVKFVILQILIYKLLCLLLPVIT